MRKLMVFNSVSLDGYFTGSNGDLSWAHRGRDAEWDAFVSGNASGNGMLVFGRITYDMMAGYWPTPMAAQNDPVVAQGMNQMPKLVFSKTMHEAAWANTTVVNGDPAPEMRRRKQEAGPDMVILGSGSIVAPLIQAGLVDDLQIVVVPVVLGRGRTMFEGVEGKPPLKLVSSRPFKNGNVVLTYAPA